MNIVQTFYDEMASQYEKLFLDWDVEAKEQAGILEGLFRAYGFERTARVLDCACGIGTQAIALAALGYSVTASDISEKELTEAKERAEKRGAPIRFAKADFRTLSESFDERFDIVIAIDNALPHMRSPEELCAAVNSIIGRTKPGGIFVASIRDYDSLLKTKPSYSPPYIHDTQNGRRVSFQTWDWQEDSYRLTQYIIEDSETLQISKFDCEYRATRREELTELLVSAGCREVEWKYPQETGFYQPIVVARKVC